MGAQRPCLLLGPPFTALSWEGSLGDGRQQLLSACRVYLPSSTQERSPVNMRPWHSDIEESRKQSPGQARRL